MLKFSAIGYARISDKDRQGGNTSIPLQIRTIENYCTSHKYNLVKIFKDEDSGKSSNRAGFKKLIEYIQEYDIKYIVLYDTSRFMRNVEEYLKLERIVKREGCTICYALFDMDETTPWGWKMKMAKIIDDEYYIKDLAFKMRNATQERARLGYWVRFAPYGYRYNFLGKDRSKTKGEKMIIPDKNYKYIQQAWRMLLNGRSSLYIANYLREKNVRSRARKKYPKGSLVTAKRLSEIFRNPVYYGAVICNYGIACQKGKHKPMITKQQFDKAQRILEKNYNETKKNLYNYEGFSNKAQIKKYRLGFSEYLQSANS